ncbi:RNA-directed RNA polymerase L [Rhizoctonia solani]|uniref:RNA-directed RNA polymerase L n=1 Tax=Rhizoctonia solani TaxID=456999 RepID=A0A8H8T0S6_9AGAM|nr:RNA-directed RNA polymerase L [Rhizoctonia solani]QRW23773.1 RNA-directed RNA polymerase L [Rhizoctonia solani]
MAVTLPVSVARDASERTSSLGRVPMQRPDMELALRREINQAVYEYPDFVNEFLAMPDHARRDDIRDTLASTPLFSYLGRDWTIDCRDLEGHESREMHTQVARLINTIAQAAFVSDQFRPVHQNVVALHNTPIKADDPNDTDSSPDIVQAMPRPDGRRHWAEVQFFAECKGKSITKSPEEQLSDALLQVARYARATLIHQIERLYVFSIITYGTDAIFVRLGRTSILHSPPFNLKENLSAFALAAAGLFALPPNLFGYDCRFYYWPRLTGLADDYNGEREIRIKIEKRRWVVLEILCQRKCLVGRATLVLLLSRVQNRHQRVVLKIIWREKSRTDEGENLANFRGWPGICQCVWSEVGLSTAVHNKDALVISPLMKSFYPPLANAKATEIRASVSGGSVRSVTSRISYATYSQSRSWLPEDRMLSTIMMDEGFALWRVERLPHLLRILRDSVVGLAGIVEQGKVHRDISEGNILCSRLPNSTEGSNGNLSDHFGSAPANNPKDYSDADITSDSDTDSDTSDALSIFSDDRSESSADTELNQLPLQPEEGIIIANERQAYIQQRYGESWPAGRLYDLEVMVKEDRPDNEARRMERTGTPAFISAQLLLATDQKPVRHTYLHDLESIFWVLVWMTATHVEPGQKRNAEAERLIGKLCRRDDETLGEFKRGFVTSAKRAHKTIIELDNGWNKAARVVFEFALLLDEHIYDKEGGPAPESDDEDTVVVNPQTTVSHASPWHILKSVIDIFDKWIAKMDVA